MELGEGLVATGEEMLNSLLGAGLHRSRVRVQLY